MEIFEFRKTVYLNSCDKANDNVICYGLREVVLCR